MIKVNLLLDKPPSRWLDRNVPRRPYLDLLWTIPPPVQALIVVSIRPGRWRAIPLVSIRSVK